MDRHPLKALVGKRSVPMDRHLLQVLVTREPRQLLKILVGLEMLDTKVGMGMLDTEVGMKRLDTKVVMGMAMLDIT